MMLFRRLFQGRAKAQSRRRSGETRRSWIAQGIERLEGRRVFAGMPPTDIGLSATSIDENLPAGITVGSFTTADADSPDGPFVYSFDGGADNLDNEHFFLTGNVIKTRESFDFENVSSYQVSVKSKDADGNSFSKMFTIDVNNLVEAPIAVDDSLVTEPNTPVSGNVLENDVDDAGAGLTVSLETAPANGEIALNADGSFTYTPAADFTGADSFTYLIEDGSGATDTATVSINVGPINDLPIAVEDAVTGDEDAPLTGNVLDNDGDPDGDELTAALGEGPAHGVVELNADGSFTYTPEADFSGADSFTYTLDDGHGGTATGAVTITVQAINDAPAAADDAVATGEDSPISGNVLINDVDVDGDALSVVLGDAPANGTVELLPDGSFTYTPSADFNGVDSFTYTVDDGNGGTAIGTVNITIDPANDAPVAVADEALGDEDGTVIGNVLANDTDVDGDALTATLGEGPAHGTVELNADGSFTYIPSADFNGSDSFTYTVDDGQGGTATGAVTITVAAVNDAPVAANDEASTDEDTPVSGNVLVNDTDIDGDALTATLADGPTNGQVELGSDGSFTYTPNADFYGVDSFTYTLDDGNGGTATGTVLITVNPVNDAPVATNDEATGDEDTIVNGNVLANDSDIDGDSLTATLLAGPANGALELNSDGSFTYTPTADFNGTDSFMYTVDDGQGGTAVGTVSITINPVNDAPVAVNDEASTDEDIAVSGNVLVNDTDIDGDALTATLDEGPASGIAQLNSDGSFTYTPNADFNGVDSFTYTLDDGQGGTASGTVTITVNAVNDAPIASNDEATTDEDTALTGNVLANDSDIDGDALTAAIGEGPANGTVELLADGSFTYTPNADFNGTDSFTYTVDDGQGGTATGTVTITVNAVNDAPLATSDEATTDEDTPVAGNVLTNDSDIDGDALTAAIGEGPANGTVELLADGSFTYTPNADFNGVDSFTYTVDDGHGGTAVGTVNITVTAVNDDPVAGDDAAVTNEDVAAVIPIADLLANDSDAEGNPVTFLAAGGAVNGTVAVSGENVIFTPSENFNGTGSFVYAVEDGNGGFAFATVTVTVNGVNDSPVAVDDAESTEAGVALSIPAASLVSNDTDADGDALSVLSVGSPTGGTVSLADGTVTFTPAEGFEGTASFHYLASDAAGGFAVGRVVVEVMPLETNTPPDAVEDAIAAQGGSAVMMAVADLLANDLDADGDSLTLTGVGNAVNGTVEMAGDQVKFKPDCDFVGTATFSYTIEDGRGGSDEGSVSIEIGEDEGIAGLIAAGRMARRGPRR